MRHTLPDFYRLPKYRHQNDEISNLLDDNKFAERILKFKHVTLLFKLLFSYSSTIVFLFSSRLNKNVI